MIKKPARKPFPEKNELIGWYLFHRLDEVKPEDHSPKLLTDIMSEFDKQSQIYWCDVIGEQHEEFRKQYGW